MADPLDNTDLETRTLAAHRAYLDALTTWERLATSEPDGRDEEHATACDAAEARKERFRIVFRDLVEELGYLPRRSDAGLPRDG